MVAHGGVSRWLMVHDERRSGHQVVNGAGVVGVAVVAAVVSYEHASALVREYCDRPITGTAERPGQ
jgi:hypothetical protein